MPAGRPTTNPLSNVEKYRVKVKINKYGKVRYIPQKKIFMFWKSIPNSCIFKGTKYEWVYYEDAIHVIEGHKYWLAKLKESKNKCKGLKDRYYIYPQRLK